MFAHVFPLHKIFHLWDTLLLGNSSFPLYIGVAILLQFRDQLMSFGFNECILHFSDMPQISIEQVVQDSVRLFRTTPRSATFRQQAPPEKQTSNNGGNLHAAIYSQLNIDTISLAELKQERCCRISGSDLIKLCELHIGGNTSGRSPSKRNKTDRPPLIVIDIRPQEDYIRGTISGSINIPHSTAFTSEGMLQPCNAVTNLNSFKQQVKVIVGGQGKGAIRFAECLLKLNYSKVCVLHKGIDGMKSSGFLTVPPATEF